MILLADPTVSPWCGQPGVALFTAEWTRRPGRCGPGGGAVGHQVVRAGAVERLTRLSAVLVHGPSMAPTLRHGDAVLVWRTPAARDGDVVVVRFRGVPGLFVKRAVRPVRGGWWVCGDNPYGSDDSGRYGPAEVVGRVLARYWPRPSWLRRRTRIQS